jgi:hypothetical protein
MKYNIYLCLLICCFSAFVSCEIKPDVNGAWSGKGAYDSWKKGDSEDVVATIGRIGTTNYLVLTNAIIIHCCPVNLM